MSRRTTLIAGLAACGALALAATASGLDRMSENRPTLAASVPGPFRVNAARNLAGQALTGNRLGEALAQARIAVRRDPVDARSLGLLGTALLASDNGPAAERAFTQSAALGWREPATQLYWMTSALELGDYEVASQRLDALLRQSPQLAGGQDWLTEFEASPQGRTALARRLADAPVWSANYFIEGHQLEPAQLARRAEVAESLGARVKNCALVAPTTFHLVATGQIPAAHRVWQQHCRRANDAGNLGDGNFSRANLIKPLTAFDWHWADDGAIGLSLAPAAGSAGRALQVTTMAPRESAFASQLVVLPPGTYRVSWRAQMAGDQPAATIRPSLSCAPKQVSPLPAIPDDPKTGRYTADFAVAANCPAQWLAFLIAPGSEAAAIGDVAITRR